MYYCVNIRLHLFIHSPTDEKIRLSFVLTTNNAAMDILVHICLCTCVSVRVSVGCTPRIRAAQLQWMLRSSVASYCQRMSHCVPNPHPHTCYGQICSFCVLGYSFIIASFLCQLFTHLFRFFYIAIGRRPWHPTPVLLPGKSHGRRSLVGCSP